MTSISLPFRQTRSNRLPPSTATTKRIRTPATIPPAAKHLPTTTTTTPTISPPTATPRNSAANHRLHTVGRCSDSESDGNQYLLWNSTTKFCRTFPTASSKRIGAPAATPTSTTTAATTSKICATTKPTIATTTPRSGHVVGRNYEKHYKGTFR